MALTTPVIRTGDTIQLAVDNTAPEYTSYFCLVPPVDEFGADAAIRGCDTEHSVSPGRSSRFSMTYTGATGQPFVVVWASSSASSDDDGGPYTVTIENITTRVSIGSIPPTRVERNFSYAATLRYGDNTPVADGSGAALQWRRAKGTPGPESFTTLATASSTGGQVVFNAGLPSEAREKIELRACADQPGGSPNCTRTATVAVADVAPAKSAACLRAQASRRTLRKRVRALPTRVVTSRGLARRRYVRKLRRATKRLKAARRAVAMRCP